MCMLSHSSRVQLFETLWTIVFQAPVSTEFSRQEYWSGLPCPPPGDLFNPAIEPTSLALQVVSLLTEPPGKPDSAVGVKRLLRKLRLERLASTAFLSTGVSAPSQPAVLCTHWQPLPKGPGSWWIILSLISFTPHLLSHPEQKNVSLDSSCQLHLWGMWADVWIRMTKGESGFMNFRLWTQGREWVRPPHSWNTFRRLSDFRQ